METAPVGATAAPAVTQRDLSNLSTEDFYKILISEMQQQDPLEPTKTQDMIAQIAQIRSIETNSQLGTSLESISRNQRVGGASALIGKYVEAMITDSSGEPALVGGIVTGVRFDSDGAAVLELDSGDAVPAESVSLVTTLDALQSALAGATEPKTGAPPAGAKSAAARLLQPPPNDNGLALALNLNG